ncbi:MAG TPA: BamA/TamA family outer membrane protein [Thermoanaerobaculia bacterium]|nr:BamA/TamA family outer membrane protein [Thermoanaerobaculia bacterium]
MKRVLAVVFLVLLFAPAAYPFGQNKIAYDTFKWSVYHSTHFDVYFYEEERPSLQKVVDSAESAYLDLSQKFNYQISKKIPLIFYATHSAFEQTNVMLNFIPEGVGAFAEPARNRMVLPIDLSDDKLQQLVQHELTHIFEYEILFQGKFGKTVTANPPTWFMEGLASFMAEDEESRDRMVLRDAVVTDRIPAITQNPQGYFAYRFGHAVFRYMREKYGWDGLRDFIYEYRNTLGSNVDRALKRAFDVTPDEFNTRFRTWLRKQYLPALVAKGEPQEYGDIFRIGEQVRSDEISPVPSPSGDLLAAFATYKEDVDVVLFNIPERKLLKNLTAGYTSRYEYPIGQSFTVGPVMGRDIAFSPNGDQVAVFAKKERGRNLLLINPITGALERSISMPVEQQLSPAYSPDGKIVAFSAIVGNQSDIFFYDLATGALTNVTSDRFFDGAPVFSPDGKWLVYSSVGEQYAKLYKLNLANPKERFQLTSGDWNDIDAWFTPDGKRLFFSSDKQTGRNVKAASDILESVENDARREGDTPPPDPTNFAAYNIYSLDLNSGDLLQYTDVIGGCFTPVVFTSENNRERMVFSSYYKGAWSLFSTPTDKPLHAAEKTTLASAPIDAEARATFKPQSEFFIDEEKVEKTHGFRLFIDDVDVNAGVSSDQLFVSRSTVYMSDMLGNRRFIASLDSVSSFSNFDFLYLDMQRRMNWGARVFDNRSFYLTANFETNKIDRRQAYRETGAIGLVSYPFTRYHRLDAGAGYINRDLYYPEFVDVGGVKQLFFNHRRDGYPVVSSTFTGDSTQFKFFGPISGRRYEVSTTYAPDISEGGTLSADFSGDFRQYYQISSRTLFAARLYTAFSEGNAPNFYYFGGLNTLRGYDFRSIIGTRAGFMNLEFRFPLVDVLATPIMVLQQVRGVVFMDVGAATFKDQPFRFTRDGRLADAKASIGWGLSFNFMGLELHWDFAEHFNGKETEGGFRTSFWIGETF